MRKLQLNVEELAVESFELAANGEQGGTVEGNESLPPTNNCTGLDGQCPRSAYPDPCGSYASICYECFITGDPYACTDFNC